MGGRHARLRLRGVLREDPQGHVRGRTDSAVRALRDHLGPEAHDGPHDGHEPRVRVRYLHYEGGDAARRARGGFTDRDHRPSRGVPD